MIEKNTESNNEVLSMYILKRYCYKVLHYKQQHYVSSTCIAICMYYTRRFKLVQGKHNGEIINSNLCVTHYLPTVY